MIKKAQNNNQRKKPSFKNSQNIKNQFENSWYFDVLGIGIIILLGILIYSNSYKCSFHFDDKSSIFNNLTIRRLPDWNTLWTWNRPIARYTFALNYHFTKLEVWGFHLVNLIIHLINSCLVFWFVLLLFSMQSLEKNLIIKHKKQIALITAFLFVSHPLATESVTYIVQRMASLAALFYLLSVILYIRARIWKKGKVVRVLMYVGSCISAYLAFHTKENSYTLPFSIMMIEIFFLHKKRFSINFKDYRVFLFLIGLLTFIVILVAKYASTGLFESLPPDEHNNYRTITPLNYFLTQFRVIVKYIQLLLLPFNQNLDNDFPLTNNFFEIGFLLCFLLLVGLIGFAVYQFNRNRILSFGIFWFFLNLSIESSFIVLNDPFMEHRTYLPSIGFFLVLSSAIYYIFWGKYKYIVISFFALMISINSYLTFSRPATPSPSMPPVPYPSDGATQAPNPPLRYVREIHTLTNNTKMSTNITVYLSSKKSDNFMDYVTTILL